ncbi:MAG: FdtA/QdtA family cupin domain-containing protein [Proteobacteria bacterium]|nr:FdtA/QdtA family cupin domain-containing protein [Pseudomonadota bacterium]
MNGGGGRARLVELPEFRDHKRGALAVAACGSQVPFIVRRAFTLYDLPLSAERGGHAHHRCEQFVLCAAGAVDLVAEDADGTASFRVDRPTSALYVPPLTWLTLAPVKVRTVIVVLASDDFDEADYIRDRVAFQALVKARRP